MEQVQEGGGTVKRRKATPVGVSEELRSRLQEPMARITLGEIAALAHRSKRTICNDMRRGRLPKPRNYGETYYWWQVRDVLPYLSGDMAPQTNEAPEADGAGGDVR